MKLNNKESTQKSFLNQINQIKINMNNLIKKTYKALIKNNSYFLKSDLEKLLNDILSIINNEMDKLSNYFLIIKENNNSDINEINKNKEYKIETNSELNIFTAKDIQEENKEITRNFQNETYNYMNINEKIENENVAKFLRYVAQISRIAYNTSYKLLKEMEEKFIKFKKKKISFNDEDIKKEFSFLMKNSEKENQIKGKSKFKEYENILNKENPLKEKENTKQGKYLFNLYYNLTLMYFHCHIAFPLVEIDFKAEENFNSEKMIDFINRGKSRKVNFVILPALFSNGNYLQNGKYWVFTFCKNTYKFEDDMVEPLNELLDIENNNIKYIKNNLKIDIVCTNKKTGKYVDINTNIVIPEYIEYEFIIYYFDKNNNQSNYFNTKLNNFEIEKYRKIKKIEFKLEGKIILSSENIKYVDDNKN